jgi:choline dehydrogenase
MWNSIKSVQCILEENKAIHYGINNMQNVSSPFHEKAPIELTSKVPTLVAKDSLGRFVRKNYYDALLEPLLQKHPHMERNIFWFQGTEVQRLLLQQQKVMGVECCTISDDLLWEIHATRQVVLCAGAIETPVILLASGIGTQEQLSGVGRHLKDQICLSRAYLTPWRRNQHVSTNGIAALGHVQVADNIFQVAIGDSTGHSPILPSALAMSMRRRCNLLQCPALWNRIFDSLFLILKMILKCAILFTPLGYILRHFTTTTLLFLMNPTSEGSVSIKPKKNVPAGEQMMRRNVIVHVDAGYLSDTRDMRVLKEGWVASGKMERCLEVFPSFVFRPLGLFCIDWFQFYSYCFSLPYFHYCGTCMMQTKSSSDWVVDTELKLRDHEGLHICDASVLPTMLSSPPALTCAALGYAFSKILLSKNDMHA